METSGDLILPPPSELTLHQRTFLDDRFTAAEGLLSVSSGLSSQLAGACSDYDRDLASLRQKLVKLTVSWIYRSIVSRSTIQSADIKLENLCLLTSPPGKRSSKVFEDELPRLVKEVMRINDIRQYVETALRLEVLVGDFEDSASVITQPQSRNVLTEMVSVNTVPKAARLRQEKVLRATKVMNEIEDILIDIAKSRSKWCHLSKSVDSRVDKTLAVIRPKIVADHRSLLVSLGWPPKLSTTVSEGRESSSGIPNPLVFMQGNKRENFAHSFLALCALQQLQARREDTRKHNSDQKQKIMQLWPMDELVSPISARMEFHFAKWVNEPELIFALVYKITREFMIGIDDVLQPLIDQARLISFSAQEAWVHSMVEMLSEFLEKKIFSQLQNCYKDKTLKAEISSKWLNLVDLVVSLDKKMLALVKMETSPFMRYNVFIGPSGGVSLLDIFCEKQEWLKVWAKIEFRDAWRKLKLELKSGKAWIRDDIKEVDLNKDSEASIYTLSTRQDHKAPRISESLVKIMQGLIERCQTLFSIPPRLKFIRSTASKLLWCFLDILVRHCVIEDLQYTSFDDELTIGRVCGSINAARYAEYHLQQWSDGVDFLDTAVVGDNGTFFREEIKSLAEHETNWLMEMIGAMLLQFETLSWEYIHNKEIIASHDPSAAGETDSSVSPDFIPALDALQGNLSRIYDSLNLKDFADLWRSVADGLDHFLFGSILTANAEITKRGIDQIAADVLALFHVFRPYCTRPEAFFPCMRDSMKLLNMTDKEVSHIRVALVSIPVNDRNCLRGFEISQLSCDHVAEVLRIRDRVGCGLC
ncbi:hypothetical protein MLD38_040245 [Melastoma candidum]|nr:hypothetical protein MLD38_040245 [Melastoma candidum]